MLFRSRDWLGNRALLKLLRSRHLASGSDMWRIRNGELPLLHSDDGISCHKTLRNSKIIFALQLWHKDSCGRCRNFKHDPTMKQLANIDSALSANLIQIQPENVCIINGL